MKFIPSFMRQVYHFGTMTAIHKKEEGVFDTKRVGLELLTQLVGYLIAYFVMAGSTARLIVLPLVLGMWLTGVMDDHGVDRWKQNHLAVGICLGLLAALFSALRPEASPLFIHSLSALVYLEVFSLGFMKVMKRKEPA